MQTTTTQSNPPTRLPRTSGEGAEQREAEGVSSSPQSLPKLTNQLLEDLQNPSITAFELCNLHGLSLFQLADLLESETYRRIIEAIERISSARTKLIEPEAIALATTRLTDILKDKPTTPAHAETQRKAANKIVSFSLVGRASSPSSPTSRARKEAVFSPPPSPNSSHLPRASGGGAEQSEAEGVSSSSSPSHPPLPQSFQKTPSPSGAPGRYSKYRCAHHPILAPRRFQI